MTVNDAKSAIAKSSNRQIPIIPIIPIIVNICLSVSGTTGALIEAAVFTGVVSPYGGNTL